jgi:hypothetical protein
VPVDYIDKKKIPLGLTRAEEITVTRIGWCMKGGMWAPSQGTTAMVVVQVDNDEQKTNGKISDNMYPAASSTY